MGARIGWGELVIILIIALIVLGPEKLPQAGRALGKAVRGVKKYIHEATQELEAFDELKDIKEDVEGIQKDLKSMGRNLEKSVSEDMEAVEQDVKAAGEEIKTAVEQEPAKAGESEKVIPAEEAASEAEENTAVQAENKNQEEA